MLKCSAHKCSSATYNKTPGISFHRFPKDTNLKKLWVQNLNRQDWQPTASSVLCSKHFEAHLKDTSTFCTVLQPGAIPTLFEEFSDNKGNLPTGRKRCAAGNLVPVLRNVQIAPEPQPCSSIYKADKETFTITESPGKICASGNFASVLQDVQNKPEMEPSTSSYSDDPT